MGVFLAVLVLSPVFTEASIPSNEVQGTVDNGILGFRLELLDGCTTVHALTRSVFNIRVPVLTRKATR
jgi:hypothetical protein